MLLANPMCRFRSLTATRGFRSAPTVFAGHSKWANIKHDKAKNDAKKAREAYSMASRIVSSVKTGGVDGNAQLATLVEKAKKLNVAKKIIDNAIKRGSGEVASDAANISSVTYEFMGPGGVAMVVEAETDNKSRTVGLLKHAFSKFNASLSPCLYLFQRKGVIVFDPKDASETLDDMLEVAIDIGAEDVLDYEDVDNEYNGDTLFQLITEPTEVNKISNELSSKGYKLRDVKVDYIADTDNEVDFPEEHEKAFKKALEMLDDIPEVTQYYTNIRE